MPNKPVHAANHRRLLVLAGDAKWARQAAAQCIAPFAHRLWIGDGAPEGDECLPSHKARLWLGRELDALAFNAHAGFDPDAFGAVIGTVRGGGLVLLLTPPLAHWPDYPDPDRARIAQHPHGLQGVSGRFLRRLANIIRYDSELTLVEQGDAVPSLGVPFPPPADPEKRISLTPDQQQAVDALVRVATGHGRRPLVLMSDRGRGKSTALGMAAAQLLLLRSGSRILVTAPRPDAVQALFDQARRLLPASARHGHCLLEGAGEISYRAPDALLHEAAHCDLLLVDEAAAIPLPLLEQFLTKYNRVAFATTEHGYEGAGRGFSLRFPTLLQRLTPHWRRMRLTTPVRWAEGDPVEDFGFHALLLNAEAAADSDLSEATPEACLLERLDRDRLAMDEGLLSELFGLLVQAHYQTRPSDLRHLLDGPDIAIWVLRHRDHVAAVLLAVDEGGFEAGLAKAIWLGQRRPQGHLLAQTLTTHAGFKEAAGMRYCRIMRLAVHPAIQRRGFGSRLVAALVADTERRGRDFVGSSFGATAGLLTFWRRLGLAPVRIGTRREAASGTHSATLLRPLSPKAHGLFDRMRHRFLESLPYLLTDPLQGLEAEVAANLLVGTVLAGVLEEQDRLDLEAFVQGRRDYAGAYLALLRLGYLHAAGGAPLAQIKPLLIKVLQGHAWDDAATLLGLTGRKGVNEALRQAAGSLLVDPKSPRFPV
ncbi:MAG: GNAT family N-acetyltransferase [Gammaproteobacteria bacterium]|nr:GNAT family N-acetyltransferase [Gammaproteobacteria bacterium]MBU1654305.1 GNAT family N-acetyltransferase [Gammaproteobacteria bacterium]MBU1961220.1 GNAT family N-acetyltransferase [Gammaproteobacteria bacterium]